MCAIERLQRFAITALAAVHLGLLARRLGEQQHVLTR
jgi:hypothetical protein